MESPTLGKPSLSDFVVSFDDFAFRECLYEDEEVDIWTAHQKSTGKFCIIKKYREKPSSFRTEVFALACAANPFIPKLIGFTNRSPFVIAIDHTDRLPLASDLKQTHLNGTQLTVIALGIAHGMARLHQLGISVPHLSCQTVMVTQRHFPKICPFDFIGESKCDDVIAYGVLLSRLLKLPEMATAQMNALIKKCTREDSSRRPSFKTIYEWFLDGSVEFHGCNRPSVERVCNRLNGVRLKNTSPERVSQERPMEMITVNELRGADDFEFLEREIRDWEVGKWCHKVEDLLMNGVPKDVIYSVAESILRKMENGKAVKEIAKSKVVRMLPFNESRMCEKMADAVCVIFRSCPEVAKDYCDVVSHIVCFDPAKGLVLIQISGTKSLAILDLLFKHESVFMKSRVGVEYISLLVRLCDKCLTFREKRFVHCRRVFCNFLNSFDRKAVMMAYSAVCLFYDDGFDPPIERLESDLGDPDLGFYALSTLIRMSDVKIRPDLAGILLSMAKSNLEASLLILNMLAQSEDWRKALLEDSSWLLLELPTLEYTLKILLVIMSYSHLRPLVSSLPHIPEFLSVMAKSKDQVTAMAVCSICTKLSFSREALADLVRMRFLPHMFSIIDYFNDDIVTEKVFRVVSHLSKFGYTKDFLIFAAKLKDVLYSDPRTSKVAFDTLYSLSVHEACARVFLKMRINEDVRELFVGLNERTQVKEFCANLANFCT